MKLSGIHEDRYKVRDHTKPTFQDLEKLGLGQGPDLKDDEELSAEFVKAQKAQKDKARKAETRKLPRPKRR